jgi:hypothetical protein
MVCNEQTTHVYGLLFDAGEQTMIIRDVCRRAVAWGSKKKKKKKESKQGN